MSAPANLGSLALGGSAVTGLAQSFKMCLSFASVVVLARLLDPQDFGLMAAGAPLVAFAGLFQNLGLHHAIVQRDGLTQEHLNQAFWLSASVSLLAAVTLAALAPFVATFYEDARLTGVVRVLALALLLAGFGTVPAALLARELRFGLLALNGGLAALGGFLTAALMAWWGWGYWSLAFAAVATAFLGLAFVWLCRPWRPVAPPRRIDRALFSFGANLTGFGLVNFVGRNGDNVLIGRALGLDALGFYDRAYKLLLFPLQNLTHPLSSVLVPLLSRIQGDRARFRSVYLRANWVLAAVAMPGVATLTMTSQETVHLLFGPRWAMVAPIFTWLGTVGFVQVVLATNGWIFICQGRTGTMFRLGLFSTSATLLAFAAGLPWGVEGVAAAYAISIYVLRVPVMIAVIHRIGPVRAADLIELLVAFALAASVAAVALATVREAMPLAEWQIVMTAGVLNYAFAGAALFLAPSGRAHAVALLKRFSPPAPSRAA